MSEENFKKRSKGIFEVIKKTPYYYGPIGIIQGLGLEEKEIHSKPFIGVANTWNELNPGHKHLRNLAEAVKYGIIEAGGIPFEFCTIAPCDGWANGNEGMQFILPQREIIADSIEAMVEAHRLDGMVTLSSCDKINPAVLMATARLDIPTICVPGGPNMYKIRFSSEYKGIDQGVYSTFKQKTSCYFCATLGACEEMGTANTTQCLMEAFGMTLPNAANTPAVSQMKYVIARKSGKQIIELIKRDIRPSQIMTKKSFENALIIDQAIGGSTNSTLHLPAIANEMDIEFDIDKFNEYSKKVPMIVNVVPSGQYGVTDLYNAGGIPAVLNRLKDYLNLDCMTVSGKPLGKLIRKSKVLNDEVIRTLDNPVFPEGGTVVLKGNLAPTCAIVKQSAVTEKDMLKFEGPAICFNSEADVLNAISSNQIENESVLVVRYQGPKGGPGMPELVSISATLMLKKNLNKVALITDGRFSGFTSGPCIGHVCPEAYEGGPIAIVQDGDIIQIDIPNKKLNVKLTEEEIQERFKDWKPFERNVKSRTLLKYKALVTDAAKGAILKF
jgi:dihydroxy-acid dehydratase